MSIYEITTELKCHECKTTSYWQDAEVYSDDRAQKQRAQESAKRNGWWIYGRGERAYCPDCKPEEARG